MSLMKWEPFSDVRRAYDEMDRMLERFLPAAILPSIAERMSCPAVDVVTQGNNVLIKAEVPGLRKEDLEVTSTNDSITLKGEFKKEEDVKTNEFIRQERRVGKFFRSIPMPDEIKPDKVKASFKDGVLTITAPLAGEVKAKETKVNIEAL